MLYFLYPTTYMKYKLNIRTHTAGYNPDNSVWKCQICNTKLIENEKYTFIHRNIELPSMKTKDYGWTCLSPECIEMRVFQMME